MFRTFPPARRDRTHAGGYILTMNTLATMAACVAMTLGQPEPVAIQPDLPPQVRLGRRAEQIRANAPVIPEVVIVPDGASYLAAVAAWKPGGRFPVLIDDGSWQAGEDIARFVRAFEPRRVVRWSGGDRVGRGEARREAVERAVASAWGHEGDPASMLDFWREHNHVPPAIVVADGADPAWTAALALAAGRALPIAWVTLERRNVSGAMSRTDADALCAEIERACEATGLSWRALGDDLDAVALCLNVAAKIETSEREFVATTDRVGRPAMGASAGERWAWSSQVFGTEAEAAYRAMCALFLRPRSAWVFDSYPHEAPWSLYDGTEAAGVLREAGLRVTLDDAPRQGLADWRARTLRAVDAGVVLLNSKGNRDWFDLSPGRAQAGDVPVLGVPAIVHMVHSWSANAPRNRATVGARWLERGAYAYCGSVQEPTLSAFVPTPTVARRLALGSAWAAAVRNDGAPLWRIAVVGDPLIALGPPARRTDDGAPLDGVEDLAETTRRAASETDYEALVRSLWLSGRDADAARLAAALLAEQRGAVTPGFARCALFSVFRAGADSVFLDLYARLTPDDAADGAARDALWFVGRRVAPQHGASRDRALLLLRQHARTDQLDADNAELAALVGG
mgnify:CR=1 FL=1